MKTRTQARSEIAAALKEVQDLLQKSSEMTAEDAEMQPESEEEAPESASVPPQAAEGQEDGTENTDPNAAPEAEMDPAAEEGGDLASHLSSMQDEELHELIDAALSELEGRSAGAPEGDMGDEAPAMPPEAAAPAPQDLEMSNKMDQMQKSINALTSQLAKSQTVAKPVAPKVVAKPVAANRVEVLAKSEPKVQRLNKSETVDFLLNQQRAGSRIVNSQVLAKANYAKTEEELHAFQDQLTKAGVSFPKL